MADPRQSLPIGGREVRARVARVDDFEYLTVGSELEALITESRLVKTYKPKYNTLLRDDKTFPYIVITDEPFPRVLRTRRVEKGRGRYFGPYANSGALNETLKLLKKLFPYRSCALNIVPDKLPKKRTLPVPESHGAGQPVLPSPSAANNFLAPPLIEGRAAEGRPVTPERAPLADLVERAGMAYGARRARMSRYSASRRARARCRRSSPRGRCRTGGRGRLRRREGSDALAHVPLWTERSWPAIVRPGAGVRPLGGGRH